MTLPYMDAFALADCCARVLADHPAIKVEAYEGQRGTRAILVEPSIRALRFLWKTGDAHQRALVAARVAVWLKRTPESVRIYAREKARLTE